MYPLALAFQAVQQWTTRSAAFTVTMQKQFPPEGSKL